MKQAMTLTGAQQKRVLQYCATRRHPTRDKTIVLFSLHTGLRAMELAALKLGDVFDVLFVERVEAARVDNHLVHAVHIMMKMEALNPNSNLLSAIQKAAMPEQCSSTQSFEKR